MNNEFDVDDFYESYEAFRSSRRKEKIARRFIEKTINSLDLIFEPSPRKSDELPYIPEPPCTGCSNFNMCKDWELACRQFSSYIHMADRSKSPFTDNEVPEWTKYSRKPNKIIYERIFRTTDTIPTQRKASGPDTAL